MINIDNRKLDELKLRTIINVTITKLVDLDIRKQILINAEDNNIGDKGIKALAKCRLSNLYFRTSIIIIIFLLD